MHSVQRTSNLSNSATIYDEIIFQTFLLTNMKEKLVSVIFQIIPDCWSSIKDTELLNISSTQMRYMVYTERLGGFHDGEPG